MSTRAALPIDALLPAIREHLTRHLSLVIEAPPGAGKTTRVPPALDGEVLVLEPRRLAARLAARRVSAELGEHVGETAGYRVRFEEVAGPKTRVTFMTEGVLTRRLLSDPALRGVSAVVLDEFHERHLEGDLALALLRRLQRTARPDLRLVVMSATMDAAPVAAYLGGAPVLGAEGRRFELSIDYTPVSSDPLEQRVASALDRLVLEGLCGDVLVFLPGASEIRRAARACEGAARRAGMLMVPLHGDLSPEEQDRAVEPAQQRKLILSTNVAESSITIEGITAVIDSGMARVARQSGWSGLPFLAISRISRASADQRAARAGRTAPGRAIRLYPFEDYQRRPAHDAPEIARAELSQTALLLAALDAGFPEWLEPPPEAAWSAANDLLKQLGAIDERGRVARRGRDMAQLPLHPRLAKLVLEAPEEGCAIAAVLSAGQRLPPETEQAGPSDLLALAESEWEPRTRQAYQQIRRLAPRRPRAAREDPPLAAILAAFPDRVARRRKGNDLLLASGGSAVLSPASVVRCHDFLVAVDIEERAERGLPLVRLASAIQPEWLVDLFPERVSERTVLEWNRDGERVEQVSVLLYDQLAIQETRGAPRDGEAAARLLAERAIEAGIGRFADSAELDEFLARVAFASQHTAVPELNGEDVRAALVSLCFGRRSFAELKAARLIEAMETRMGAERMRLVAEYAPERIRLPSGRQVRVRYARGQRPWIAAKLQEFFGLDDTPRVARGAVPLVVHLLAPNDRPVQTTTDLASFWRRLYPEIRRQLQRRYPRHRWPENPATTKSS
jgi:ATP-dependent helicase HrpB